MAAENKRKQERIEKLEHDRSVQELEIRKRLKLLHPGETQFILPEQKTDTEALIVGSMFRRSLQQLFNLPCTALPSLPLTSLP